MTTPLRVLMVEDDPSFAEWVEAHLGDAEVSRASTLAEALVALAQYRFDVMLLDLTLPDASGLGTVERALMAPSPPAIVVTNVRDEVLRRKCLERGAQGFLDKGELANAANPTHYLRHEIEDSMARQHGVNERLLHLVGLVGRAATTEQE